MRYLWPDAPPLDVDDAFGRGRLFGLRFGFLHLLDDAIEARRTALAAAADADEDRWLPIGPSTVVDGQASGRPRVAGRIRDLAVSPDASRLYAGTAGGGVWFSGDSGTTWWPVGGWATEADPASAIGSANALTCGSLLVRWGATADDDEVYVGTGELSARRGGTPGSRMGGVGILRLATPVTTAITQPTTDPWRREAPNLAGFGIYRLGMDPDDPGTLVAATSAGLFTRSGGFVEEADWTKVTRDPFDFEADDAEHCTDVLWTPARGTTPKRLFVALTRAGSDTAVYRTEAGPDSDYTKVELSGVDRDGRLGLAAQTHGPGADPSVVYVLGKGPKLWRIDGTTARGISGAPPDLFGSAGKDQSDYDLTIEVHPAAKQTIVVGGSFKGGDASLYRADVTGAPGSLSLTNLAFIGEGVHADVHAARYAPDASPLELWIGCDGGVFRSRAAGDPDTFTPRNDGLAVLEPGYAATHPQVQSVVLVGTQDNGVLQRVGDTLWQLVEYGDGGGVAYHPHRGGAYMAQYIRGKWRSARSATGPLFRGSDDSDDPENRRALFYSGISVRSAGGTAARVAVGTDRVWIAEDWDPVAAARPSWQTLPSTDDPRAASPPDLGKDRLPEGGAVVALRWATDDKLFVLAMRAVYVFSRTGGTWRRDKIARHHDPKCGTFDNDDITQPTSEYVPPLGHWSDIAVHDPARGTHGSCYVATTGYAFEEGDQILDAPRMDTLWWFDGDGAWSPTGLRAANKAPAYAVARDPDDVGVVYVGTAIGVWRGTLTFADATPRWDWEVYSNGLPEASVEDLHFSSVPTPTGATSKLLRAAVRARGVWEVDLSADPSPPQRCYLRVHDHDLRRVLPTSLTHPSSGTHRWDRSPDIKVHATEDLFAAKPATLPWTSATFPSSTTPSVALWKLQSMLHQLDPVVQPDGLWDAEFSERVTAYRSARALGAGALVDGATWDDIVARTAGLLTTTLLPWDGPAPTEADLYELVPETLTGGRVRVERATTNVHVLTHRRHPTAVPEADVKVLLLRRRLAAAEGDGAGVATSGPWRAQVVSRLQGGTAPVNADGWGLADPATPVRNPSGPLDARNPQAVTFDVDWSTAATPAGSSWLLLAVLTTTADPVDAAALGGATLRDLVLASHHVAAKAVRV